LLEKLTDDKARLDSKIFYTGSLDKTVEKKQSEIDVGDEEFTPSEENSKLKRSRKPNPEVPLSHSTLIEVKKKKIGRRRVPESYRNDFVTGQFNLDVETTFELLETKEELEKLQKFFDCYS